jgi:class 3 adenylate cyclase/pimeloyl-ACP methyl ester carboxylesterase
MKRPETRYARSDDLMIAYQVTGEANAIDLIMAPGTVSHVVMAWNWPETVALYERLSSFARLIRFDKRGTGMSDRPTGAATLEERSDDIRAVMDAADSQRAYVLGISEGGNMACVFAATYPERTLGLLLWGTMARWTSIEGYPWGPPIDDWRRVVDDLATRGVTDEYLLGYGAGLSKEELERERSEWLAMASPGALAALERMNIDIDTRAILPSIHVPTLVMNRHGDPVAHVDAARDLAVHIAGARFVEFPGDLHSISEFEPEAVIAEIQEFVTGVRPALVVDRVLVTVLFTDIVDSTRLAAKFGDVTWKKRLAEHDRLARREIERHRGVLVDTTGDGLLATFDGPARAVRCALAIASAVGSLGLSVRAGAHTGEVERDGDQIRGLAVHIGARVAALAGPSEVLVSSTVRDLTVGSGIAYEDRGEHELKGVPDRWRLFAVVGPGASAT